MALGAARDPGLAEALADLLGRELAALGINWNFAPVADLAHQSGNPSLGARSAGADPQLVSELVKAQVRGFQRAGVAATVKHFPGLGNSLIDTHEALATVSGSLDDLHQQDLLPFRAAIDASVACVMISHVRFDALDERLPASLSPRVVDDLLRRQLRFDGAVCSDCLEMKAISDSFDVGKAAALSAMAGVDMPLISHTPAHQLAAGHALLEAFTSGRISAARIDRSLARINALKRQFNLRKRPPLEIVGCPDHARLAARAARAGIAFIKRGRHFPLPASDLRLASVEFLTQGDQQPSAFSQWLRASFPGAACHQLLAAGADRISHLYQALDAADALIIATRDAHLHPPQMSAAQQLIQRHPRSIVVALRAPWDAAGLAGADTIVCSHGDSSLSLKAAVDALRGAFVPSGQLTLPASRGPENAE